MSDHTHRPHTDMPLHGLYLDAETDGPADAHDRLVALALLPFTVDHADWRIVPCLDAALDCPDPHRPTAAAADARAPGIDLARARALVETARLLVTHTRCFSLALLVELLPALVRLRWLAWELGLPDPDGSVLVPGRASRGLRACKSGLWLLAQFDAASDRPLLAVQLEQAAAAPPPRPRLPRASSEAFGAPAMQHPRRAPRRPDPHKETTMTSATNELPSPTRLTSSFATVCRPAHRPE